MLGQKEALVVVEQPELGRGRSQQLQTGSGGLVWGSSSADLKQYYVKQVQHDSNNKI